MEYVNETPEHENKISNIGQTIFSRPFVNLANKQQRIQKMLSLALPLILFLNSPVVLFPQTVQGSLILTNLRT